MIQRHGFFFTDLQREATRELSLLSIVAQSFFQPFSIVDNLLVILTALTSGAGIGFNRAMLFLKKDDRLKGEMWLGPRSADEAATIWEVLSHPGIGYIEIIEHNRSLVARNADTLSRRIRELSYSLEAAVLTVPALPVRDKHIYHVREAGSDPLVDKKFHAIIGQDEFLCVPLVAGDNSFGVIILDNAITGNPIGVREVELAGLCGLIAGNYVHSAELHQKIIDMERMAALGEMAAFITHQLRNPLTVIGGFADQILNGRASGDKRERNLGIIRDEIRRLENFVEKIAQHFKTRSKEPEYFDLRPLVEDVLRNPAIADKSAAIRLVLKMPEETPQVLGIPAAMAEVVRNIVDNALDATTPGGEVVIRGARRNTSWFVLSFKDSGAGIPSRDLDRMFTPFFTTKEKGMGLGLLFAKRMMEASGGRVEIQSRQGKGTLIRLILKCREKGETP